MWLKGIAPALVILLVVSLVSTFGLAYKLIVEEQQLQPQISGDLLRDLGAAFGPVDPGGLVLGILNAVVNGAIKFSKIITILLTYPIRFFVPGAVLPFLIGFFIFVLGATITFQKLINRVWESSHSTATVLGVLLLSVTVVVIILVTLGVRVVPG